ncbi:MAG: PKD domain-containing protein [Thiotrichales bacterium]
MESNTLRSTLLSTYGYRTVCTSLLLVLAGSISSAYAGVVEQRVISSHDDAEERSDGKISRKSSDLELVFNRGGNQTIGLRFTGLSIPQGATISQAWIQFQADEKDSEATSLTIDAQAADDTSAFKTTRYSISSRPRTAASTTWNPPAWNTVGEAGPAQQTPDLSSVVAEVVARPGWQSGNAMTFIIEGTGKRVAESWNGDSSGAPLLHVEYSGGFNNPPSVDAGPDTSITLPTTSVSLDATVNDDGLPYGSLTSSWSHVGGTGPGTVSFTDPGAVDTIANFSADPGTYQLRLTVSDGDLTASDDIVVQILAENVGSSVQSITQVNYFDTGYDQFGYPLTIPSTDPAGVLYDASTGQLIIADSEINEIPEVWDNAPWNLFMTTLTGASLEGQYDLTVRQGSVYRNKEPTGIAYCANDGHYYVSNDDNKLVYHYSFDSVNGFTLIDAVSTVGATSDPEGITCDPATGKIYVVGGNNINIVVYRYQNSFVLDSIIDLPTTAGIAAGIPSDPEGIAFDITSGHLFVMSNDDDAIFEYTDQGVFIDKFDISGFSPRPKQPQGLAIGPSSVTPGKESFYISDAMVDNNHDPNERDGRIFEAEIDRP